MTAYKCRGYSDERERWVTGYAFEHEPPLYTTDKDGKPLRSVWYIVQTRDDTPAVDREVDFIQVNEATIGVYSQINDVDGLAIFQGDVLKSDGPVITGEAARDEHLYFVTNEDGCFWISNGAQRALLYTVRQFMRIVGNMYDNPVYAVAAKFCAE